MVNLSSQELEATTTRKLRMLTSCGNVTTPSLSVRRVRGKRLFWRLPSRRRESLLPPLCVLCNLLCVASLMGPRSSIPVAGHSQGRCFRPLYNCTFIAAPSPIHTYVFASAKNGLRPHILTSHLTRRGS